jgi:hypothetical protein
MSQGKVYEWVEKIQRRAEEWWWWWWWWCMFWAAVECKHVLRLSISISVVGTTEESKLIKLRQSY